MSRLDARWRHFWTSQKVYRHFWQNFLSGDVNQNGSTVVVTASVPTSGHVTTQANVSGQTLARNATLIAGAASGGANATGINILETWSLFSGSATGQASAAGSIMAVNNVVIGGLHTTDGNAPLNLRLNAAYRHFWNRRRTHRHLWTHYEGADVSIIAPALVIVFSILVEGQVSSDVSVSGTTMSRAVSLIPGSAHGDANESSQGIDVWATIVNGELTADVHVAGSTVTATSSILSGIFVPGKILTTETDIISGSAVGNGHALGDLVSVQVLLVNDFANGKASGDANLDGTTTVVTAELFAGQAFDSNSALTLGSVLVVLDGLVVLGEVTADAFLYGQLLVVTASLLDGTENIDGSADGELLVVTALLLPGTGFAINPGDGIAFGSVLEVDCTVTAGLAFGDKQPAPNTMGGVTTSRRIRAKRVNVVAPGAVVAAQARLRAGHAHGQYAFSIPLSQAPSLAPPFVLGEIGLAPRKAVVSGGLVVAHADMGSGRAAGHANALGAVLEGGDPWDDEDEMMLLEEFA